MSVDILRSGFVSDELVDRMAEDQRRRLAEAPNDPVLGVILGYPDGANISYAQQTLVHGDRLANSTGSGEPPVELYVPTMNGFDVVRTPDEFIDARRRGLYQPLGSKEADAHDKRIVELVEELNDRPDVLGQLPLLRCATKAGDLAIRNAIDPGKDVDGISPRRLVTPATPEAQVAFAEAIIGQPIANIDPRTIAVIGKGPLVGVPLCEEVLPAHGVDVTELGAVLATREQIENDLPNLAERASQADELPIKLIFTAVPVGALIRRGAVSEDGVVIIDAGFGINPETNQPSGNVHPGLLALNGLSGNVITAFRRGLGPVTASIIFDRTIPASMQDRTQTTQAYNLVVASA